MNILNNFNAISKLFLFCAGLLPPNQKIILFGGKAFLARAFSHKLPAAAAFENILDFKENFAYNKRQEKVKPLKTVSRCD